MTLNKLIDVYPYSFDDDGKVHFLLFKRSENVVYKNQWRMIGGKVGTNEYYWKAAEREFFEETGLTPEKMWSVPTINQFYDYKSDSILQAVPFAVELANLAQPSLNHEHQKFAWVKSGEWENLGLWPEQMRIMTVIESLLAQGAIKSEWVIEL